MRKLARAIASVAGMAARKAFLGAIAVALVLLPMHVHPQGAPLDPSTMRDLLEKGMLTRDFHGGDALQYAPKTHGGAVLSAEAATFDANVAVEVVRLIPDTSRRLAGEAGRLLMLNTLCSVSTMKGITYWSRSRNARRVLFSESYAVDSPQGRARVPDPSFTSPPAEGSFYSVQEDSSFGRNVYATTFTSAADGLRARIENLTPVSFLFVTIIPKGGLVTLSLIVPTEEGVLFYGISMLRSSFPMGDPKARSESLANRVVAVSDWLKERLGL